MDLIFKKGRNLIPVEIKAAMTYHPSLHKGVSFFQNQAGSEAGYLVYGGEMSIKKEKISVINFHQTYQIFDRDSTD